VQDFSLHVMTKYAFSEEEKLNDKLFGQHVL